MDSPADIGHTAEASEIRVPDVFGSSETKCPEALIGSEIAIDARWLRTGLGTYIYNLIIGLRRVRESWPLRALVNEGSVARVAPWCNSVVVMKTAIYTMREQIEVPWAARGAALLHVPHYNAPILHRGKLVVTIHDLIHLMGSKGHNRVAVRLYAQIMMNTVARKADHIVTVSEFTRGKIVDLLGINPNKITVIPNGVSHEFRPLGVFDACEKAATLLGRPYFLYVGNLKPHKNLSRLLGAMALLRERHKLDWMLLIAGPGDAEESKNLIAYAARLGIQESIAMRHDMERDELVKIYRGAQFVVAPSLLEGFGLPVLEAMACGTPVVCSNAASLPEVGGDAVRYFDPLDLDDMSSALEEIASSSELRTELRQKGLKRASQFSWDKSARRHASVFEQVMSS